MSLDLRLLPVDCDAGAWGYSRSIIELGGADDIHEWIKNVPRHELPRSFSTFCSVGKDGDPCYGNTTHTPYGEKLDAVRAGDLMPFADFGDVKQYYARRAAWAYLAELPPETLVALYWH